MEVERAPGLRARRLAKQCGMDRTKSRSAPNMECGIRPPHSGAPGPGPLAMPSVTWSGLALATGPGRCYHRCQ
jgi:hypothetical protein